MTERSYADAFYSGRERGLKRQAAIAEAKAAKEKSERQLLEDGYQRNPETGKLEDIPGSTGALKRRGANLEEQTGVYRDEAVLKVLKEQEFVNNKFFIAESMGQFLEQGDPDILNKAAKRIPKLGQMLQARGIHTFHRVDRQNDKPLLEAVGIDIALLDADPEYAKQVDRSYYKIIGTNGEPSIGSVKQLMQETNADTILSRDIIDRAQARIKQIDQFGLTPQQSEQARQADQTHGLEEQKQSHNEYSTAVDDDRLDRRLDLDTTTAANQHLIDQQNADSTTQNSDTTKARLAHDKKQTLVNNVFKQIELGQAAATHKLARDKFENPATGGTNVQKNVAAANGIRTNAYQLAGATSAADYRNKIAGIAKDNPELYGQLMEGVVDYAVIKGQKLDEGAKKLIIGVSQVASLADASTGLIDDTTGFFDTLVTDFKTYTGNSAEGLEAKFAYEQLSNLEKKLIYGSAVSKSEEASFYRGTASSKRQILPILSSLIVKMGSQIDTIKQLRLLEDPFVIDSMLASTGASLDGTYKKLTEERDRLIKLENNILSSISPAPIGTATVPGSQGARIPVKGASGQSLDNLANEAGI